MERISRDELFMEMSYLVAKRSICQRAQVGAVIVVDRRPVSIGYNGPPSGVDVCCFGGSECKAIHAEMNAIAWAARRGIAIDGGTLYVTMAPCEHCAKIILNSGITRVVYGEDYRKTEGLELLDGLCEKYVKGV